MIPYLVKTYINEKLIRKSSLNNNYGAIQITVKSFNDHSYFYSVQGFPSLNKFWEFLGENSSKKESIFKILKNPFREYEMV